MEPKVLCINCFLYLERNNKAIGNITVCERNVTINNSNQDGLYIRYFAFDTIFQGGNKKREGQSGFHSYFRELFKTSNLDPTNPKRNKSMYWAFIDPDNARSHNMNDRFGFETIGQFKTTAFSRSNPKMHANVSRITSSDKSEVLEKIKSFYSDFNFFSEVHLFDNDDYYVLKDKDVIVAGIQANPVHWAIKSLPGMSGKFLMKAAPIIPGIRKIINPKNHKFLATEGLFWKEGYADQVTKLLEGALALSKHNSMLIWTDIQNDHLSELKVKWGFIQKSKKDKVVNIVGKFNGFESKEIDQIKASKKYLSGFDMT